VAEQFSVSYSPDLKSRVSFHSLFLAAEFCKKSNIAKIIYISNFVVQ
jgi:hypothetical protein